MPTLYTRDVCKKNQTDCPFEVDECASNNSSRKTILVVDRASNVHRQQNILHLMTRAYTAWFALHVLNVSNADVHFKAEPPFGRVSHDVWDMVSGGGSIVVHRAHPCEYERVVRLEDLPPNLWHRRRADCRRSSASKLWRIFTNSLMLRVHHPQVAHTPCFLLRDRTQKTSRREFRIEDLLKHVRVTPIYFDSRQGLRAHMQLMQQCHAAVGIRGAQLMNIMWMPPAGRVLEYDEPRSQNWLYRNVAHLSGHAHTRCNICNNRTWCDAQQTKMGVYIHPAPLRDRLASLF